MTISEYNCQSVDVEAIVRKVMSEMAAKKTPATDKKKSSSSTKKTKKDRDNSTKSKKDSRSKRKSKKSTKKKSEKNDKLFSQIENLVSELHELRQEYAADEKKPKIPIQVLTNEKEEISQFSYDSDDSSTRTGTTEESTKSGRSTEIGSPDFYREVASKLKGQRKSICIQGDYDLSSDDIDLEDNANAIHDFESAFGPNDMRCLALVSHNEMKATMKDFVIQNKHILKKFRLTGTQSTMKMLAEVFKDEPDVVFGPSCQSGPLGGDAELVALMTSGNLGGILFFQDPMSSHPHQADIQCLVRQAIVHNTVLANTPTTAMSLMQVFKMALAGAGKPELIPSFFFSLQSPTVSSYKIQQSEVIKRNSTVTFR